MLSKIEESLLLAADLRPYYARAISALTPVPSEHVPTISVDTSWRLYYSPEWVEETPLQQLGAVIAAHEVEHLLRDHAGRRCDRDSRAWNVAGDLEINDDTDLTLPDGGLYPSQHGLPDGLMAEEYYDRLPAVESHPCGSGAGCPMPGELEPTGLGLDAAAQSALVQAVREDVRTHEARAPGSVPAGVVMWASSTPAAVRLPWTRLLSAALRSGTVTRGRSDYSWSRLPRRNSGVLRPGTVSYRPVVTLIVDTSGSMSSDGSNVLGVVQDLLSRSGADVSILSCDAAAKRRGRRAAWTGGGGTDLREAFRLVSRRSSAIVVVTDGETPWPDTAPIQPTIVVSTASRGPQWARTILVSR